VSVVVHASFETTKDANPFKPCSKDSLQGAVKKACRTKTEEMDQNEREDVCLGRGKERKLVHSTLTNI
jgi:hypothetical protein